MTMGKKPETIVASVVRTEKYSEEDNKIRKRPKMWSKMMKVTKMMTNVTIDKKYGRVYTRKEFEDGAGVLGTRVNIPPTFMSIGEEAFEECESITVIKISNSVKFIGRSAFRQCSGLIFITLPTSLTIIEGGAFGFCSSLRAINLPPSLTTIREMVFYKCSSLTVINLSRSLKSIEGGAFDGCTALTTIDLPLSLTTIEERAFGSCTSLTAIDLPPPLTTIEGWTFSGCGSLRAITLPPFLRTIGEGAFDGCSSLTAIDLPPSLTTIEGRAFYKCSSLTAVDVPPSLTTIRNNIFTGCSSLTTVNLPPSLTTIEEGAFDGCTALTTIHLPPSLTTIGERAFGDCSSLIMVDLPPSFMTIGEWTFSGCWSLIAINLPASLRTIEWGAFNGCRSLTTISLPPSLTTIGKKTFLGCSSLETINLPLSLTTIKGWAFSGCSSLKVIDFPPSLTTIEESAFDDCTSLTTVDLPPSFMTIKGGAFSRCSSLTVINLPPSVTTIEGEAFRSCTSLTTIALPPSLTAIREKTFYGCTFLTTIVFPQSLKTVGEKAFGKCKSLTTIQIKKNKFLFTIEKNAFLDCDQFGLDHEEQVHSLRSRFKDLPLHQICSQTDVTPEGIHNSIKKYPDSVKKADSLGCTALHLLVANQSVTLELYRMVVRAHPESLVCKTFSNMLPIHLACLNFKIPEDIIIKLATENLRSADEYLLSRDTLSRIPVTHAICSSLDYSVQKRLFAAEPIGTEYFTIKETEQRNKLQIIQKEYEDDLFEMLEKWDSYSKLSLIKKNGFVVYMKNIKGDSRDKWIKFLQSGEKCPQLAIEAIAKFKDNKGRLLQDVVEQDIKKIILKRTLFLGQFKIDDGPPLHKSATALILKAKDLETNQHYLDSFKEIAEGESFISKEQFETIARKISGTESKIQINEWFEKYDLSSDDEIDSKEFITFCREFIEGGREHRSVALKFMKNKTEFDTAKKFHKVQISSVLQVEKFYDADENSAFRNDLINWKKKIEMDSRIESFEYKYCIVMQCGDRNLDMIYRCEKPDVNKSIIYVKTIANALKGLQAKNLCHCDLKMANCVRFNKDLKIIDMDASSEVLPDNDEIKKREDRFYVGKKFSSGILPPEMIHCIDEFTDHGKEELAKFQEYFKELKITDKEKWKKIQPIRSSKGKGKIYVVKTFLSECDSNDTVKCIKGEQDDLPYSPVLASESIDLWSLGVLISTLLSGKSLFSTDVNDDLQSFEAFESLATWTDARKEDFIQNEKSISSTAAEDLLKKLLSKDPLSRGSIQSTLDHHFFKSEADFITFKEQLKEKENKHQKEVKILKVKLSEVSERDKKQQEEQAKEVKEKIDNPEARNGIVLSQQDMMVSLFNYLTSEGKYTYIEHIETKRKETQKIIKNEIHRISKLIESRTEYYMKLKVRWDYLKKIKIDNNATKPHVQPLRLGMIGLDDSHSHVPRKEKFDCVLVALNSSRVLLGYYKSSMELVVKKLNIASTIHDLHLPQSSIKDVLQFSSDSNSLVGGERVALTFGPIRKADRVGAKIKEYQQDIEKGDKPANIGDRTLRGIDYVLDW
eukprot:CAMPEP_0194315314 /NCGR_PEP_ID=MMETSP0171-20130528/12109_1 /TAXON_ID=218684 /ORGANISM="Corethron pennatum, Strain L29A3" /LENGTH=1557 /DNA_ID=CAMNT_0039071075 /DNA_START=43 /DNA_END=4713 /DNA_ORIENTATION=+